MIADRRSTKCGLLAVGGAGCVVVGVRVMVEVRVAALALAIADELVAALGAGGEVGRRGLGLDAHVALSVALVHRRWRRDAGVVAGLVRGAVALAVDKAVAVVLVAGPGEAGLCVHRKWQMVGSQRHSCRLPAGFTGSMAAHSPAQAWKSPPVG